MSCLTLEFIPKGWLENGLGDPPGHLLLGGLGLGCGSRVLVSGSFLPLLFLLQEAEGLQGGQQQLLPLLDPRLPACFTACHQLLVEGQVDVRRHGLRPELSLTLGLLLALPPPLLEGGGGCQPLCLLAGLA